MLNNLLLTFFFFSVAEHLEAQAGFLLHLACSQSMLHVHLCCPQYLAGPCQAAETPSGLRG